MLTSCDGTHRLAIPYYCNIIDRFLQLPATVMTPNFGSAPPRQPPSAGAGPAPGGQDALGVCSACATATKQPIPLVYRSRPNGHKPRWIYDIMAGGSRRPQRPNVLRPTKLTFCDM